MRKGTEVLRGPLSLWEFRSFKEKQGASGGEPEAATESICEGFSKLHEWTALLAAKAGFMPEQAAFEQPKETNSTR